MTCRFRGGFTNQEKVRIEQAAERFERARGNAKDAEPMWAFIHFNTPYQGSPYWGVRIENGFMVKAQTAKGLAMAVDVAREEALKQRSRALRHASQSVSQALGH